MKKICLWFATVAVLSGCNMSSSVPDPSPNQDKIAQATYDLLRQGQLEAANQNFEPQLQQYFAQNQKQMKKFSHVLPKTDYKTKKIVAKNIDQNMYTVSYEYAYDGNLVQYNVSFDRPQGSEKIRNLDIQVFGK